MSFRLALIWGLLICLPCGVSQAALITIRDSIGPTPGTTNGLGGGLTLHDGGFWNTPGLVVTAPEDGKLAEARFVIFARGGLDATSPPENNLSNIYGFSMRFHIWTDGIESGPDSFDQNPDGANVTGHISVNVNSASESFVTIIPFGQTGPLNEFITFLVTVDLSNFDLEVESGNQYVMGLTQNGDNFVTGQGFFRISGSRATGFEDVFRAWNTSPTLRPGYLKTQLGNSFEQYAGAFSMEVAVPEPQSAALAALALPLLIPMLRRRRVR